jgi:putative ABC transport system permease protein
VIRWAWRLFLREWRQQLLLIGLLTVAVAATIWGAGVATNTPPPGTATFGTATASISLPGTEPQLAAVIAAIQRRYGPVDVIENQALSTGAAQSVELRAQDPAGRFGAPLLALDSGRYPAGAGQVALTSQVASLYDLRTGGTWQADGRSWLVTGIVENPTDLNDEFALVAPGQVTAPTQVTILLNAPPGAGQNQLRPGPSAPVFHGLPADATVSLASQAGNQGIISPATIVLAVAVLGLVFIGLVSVAGFTVLAQRRLRALGMLAALGATERNVRLVMTASGAVIGLTAAVVGAVLGFAAWVAYVPSLETDTAHRIDPLNVPWWAIAAGVALAVVTSVLAARRPARTMARVPVVAALSGRPAAAPKSVRRSALPGLALVAGGAACLLFSGGWGGNSGSDALLLLGGLVAIIAGIFLLAPACVTVLTAGAGPRVPVAVRIALRDLVRQRARSGAAVAAVSFAVFLAMLIGIIASVRFSNVLDYTGQNLTSDQLIMYTQDQGPNASPGGGLTSSQVAALHAKVDAFAASLHAPYVLPLDTVNATLIQAGRGNNNFSGTLYVATPALLADYGIKPSQIDPDADILSMRPGLGSLPNMQLLYGDLGNPQANPSAAGNPKIQQIAGLPSGTSAPNTVITTHAIHQYKLHTSLDGWFIQAPKPVTSAQISAARQIAANAGVTAETKSGELGLGQISDGATVLGLAIALGVLVMSVGLVRSETTGELRTLAATGASSRIRRTITGATAGAIGLLGAVLGAAGATAAGVAWAHSSLTTTFGNFPVPDLLALLVGLPLVAVAGGWLLAGRQPQVIARQALD